MVHLKSRKTVKVIPQKRGFAEEIKVPMELVKELRAKTKAGVLECRQALIDSNLNMEVAAADLEEKARVMLAKKQSRVAAEGVLALFRKDNKVSAIEVS